MGCTQALPLRNLGLEGTPHYMAPESLSSEVRGRPPCTPPLPHVLPRGCHPALAQAAPLCTISQAAGGRCSTQRPQVYPATDVWAAGVMAYQLLSGRFPFDDWKNLKNPALSQLW